MTTRVPAALLGLLLAFLASTGAPVAAASDRPDTLRLPDGTGDVWMTPDGGDIASPAPDRRTGDIVGERIAHRAEAVVVRLRFADLTGPGTQRHELTIVTPTTRWFANVVATAANRSGRHHLWAGNGDRVTCGGMTQARGDVVVGATSCIVDPLTHLARP